MENERGFTIKDLLIRLVLIVVFIFLLIWLFPMPDLKPLNNQIFAENLDRMKNVAKTYITILIVFNIMNIVDSSISLLFFVFNFISTPFFSSNPSQNALATNIIIAIFETYVYNRPVIINIKESSRYEEAHC